jgi:TusA-related sulfurtransferase
MFVPDKTLDVQKIGGSRVRTIALRTLQLMQRGQVLKLITTEKDVKRGIAELCHEEGYILLEEVLDGSRHSLLIRR